MRLTLLCLLLFAAAPASAGAPFHATPSAPNLLRLHPGPWQFPSQALHSGMRFDPESGEAAAAVSSSAAVAHDAELRADAESRVRLLADGSRHAVLNGALRSWTVATIDDQGRLIQDCVHSEAEARERIQSAAAAKSVVRK